MSSLPSSNLLWVVAAVFLALVAGTVVRTVKLRGVSQEAASRYLDSLWTWWLVAVLGAATALLGLTFAVALLAIVSSLAFCEFVRLTGGRPDRGLALSGYLLIALQYGWIWLGWFEAAIAFIPLAALSLIAVKAAAADRIHGFVREAASWLWGLTLTAWCLSHAGLLFALPATSNPVAGGGGWFLFLLLLTESNDIVQALAGRRFGKRKLSPLVSPHKTWEGFLIGNVSTIALSVGLAPWLTPLSWGWSAVAGFLIGLAGLLGDLNVSAVKREAGVKDSSSLLPGHGGMLDRVDSLIFTAPLFYYFVLVLD